MSIKVGGTRQQPAQVRHISKCQNPHCGNTQLTRLVDYAGCNVCGWNTRMNAQDVLDKFGPYPAPKVETAVSASGEDAHPSAPRELDYGASLDAVAAEQKATEDTSHAQESAPVSKAPVGTSDNADVARIKGEKWGKKRGQA